MKLTRLLLAFVVMTISGLLLLLAWSRISARPSSSLEVVDLHADQGSLERQIVAKEREELDALKSGDVNRFADLTADDAVFVDAMGPASKAQVVKNVEGFTLSDYSMDDVRYVPLSSNSGLITYRIHEKGVSHGRPFEAQPYISSIWMKRKGKWVCLFSQETSAR